MKQNCRGFGPCVYLRFTEVLVNELYASWWYDVGVIVYVHLFKLFQHIGVVEPVAKALGAHFIFGCKFGFCFRFYGYHGSKYCGCLAHTLVPRTILSPVTWHSSTMGFWSTIEYIYGLSVIQCLYGHVSQKAFGFIFGFCRLAIIV